MDNFSRGTAIHARKWVKGEDGPGVGRGCGAGIRRTAAGLSQSLDKMGAWQNTASPIGLSRAPEGKTDETRLRSRCFRHGGLRDEC
ncbi:hypothetical protein KCP75_23915 [Salmonella enterica subsp. enterica]|nr:hypothetical protein KCP75_23915 [Salmonella enterica subsp. enterica]